MARMKALLLLWAVGATVLAAVGWTRDPQLPARAAPTSSTRTRTEVRVLERKVKQLEAVLAGALQSDSESDTEAKGIRDLVAEVVALEEGDWNQKDFGRLHREILRLIMSDPNSHRDLMRLLEADPARADDVAGHLLTPYAQLCSNTKVTAEMREIANRLLVEGTPEQRAAAARILMGYAPPRREDVVHALVRLQEDPDAEVRDTLLLAIADHGQEVGLTEEETEPFFQVLREQFRSGEEWCATALAQWSGTDGDYDLVQAAFRDSTDDGFRMDILNAFHPETRMAGTRYLQARAFLVEIISDRSHSDDLREWALGFLKLYTPWDPATAEAVRLAR